MHNDQDPPSSAPPAETSKDHNTEEGKTKVSSFHAPLKRNLRRDLLLGFLIVACGLGVTFFLIKTKPKAQPEPIVERSWAVDGLKAHWKSLQPTLTVFGEVVAGNELDLRPLVSGRVTAIGPDLQDGAVVATGDLLVAIDPFDYEADVAEKEAALLEAKAKLAENAAQIKAETELLAASRTSLTLRQRDMNRKRDLRKKGSGTQKALDDAALAVSEARQSVTTRQQGIVQKKAQSDQLAAAITRAEVALKRAQRNLEDTRLTAPFDGFIAETDVAVGKHVSTNDKVARLIDAERLEVRFQLSNGDFARLIEASQKDSSKDSITYNGDRGLIGRPLTVYWNVGGGHYRYEGTVDRVGAEIDSASGGVDLFGRLTTNSQAIPLRPGAFVQVELPDRHYHAVLSVPESAVTSDHKIFLVNPLTEEAEENRDSQTSNISETADQKEAAPNKVSTSHNKDLLSGRLQERQISVLRQVGDHMLITGEKIPDDAIIAVSHFPEIGPDVKVTLRRFLEE